MRGAGADRSGDEAVLVVVWAAERCVSDMEVILGCDDAGNPDA
jgi:hypothetical protein